MSADKYPIIFSRQMEAVVYIFDRIVCVLVTFYRRGHFVILTIRNLNLISVQSLVDPFYRKYSYN